MLTVKDIKGSVLKGTVFVQKSCYFIFSGSGLANDQYGKPAFAVFLYNMGCVAYFVRASIVIEIVGEVLFGFILDPESRGFFGKNGVFPADDYGSIFLSRIIEMSAGESVNLIADLPGD